MFDRGIPSICYALRGLAYFQIDLRGTSSDLHSGVFGGAVANPAMVLAQILAQARDRGGRIKIPGFYDDVRPLSEEEREEWEQLPFSEKRYRQSSARRSCSANPAIRPWSAYGQGRPSRSTACSAASQAKAPRRSSRPSPMAKVSMRLVPDQDRQIADPVRSVPREGRAQDLSV